MRRLLLAATATAGLSISGASATPSYTAPQVTPTTPVDWYCGPHCQQRRWYWRHHDPYYYGWGYRPDQPYYGRSNPYGGYYGSYGYYGGSAYRPDGTQ